MKTKMDMIIFAIEMHLKVDLMNLNTQKNNLGDKMSRDFNLSVNFKLSKK